MAIVLDKIFLRFYRGQEVDEEIADYLAQFDNAPRGTKPKKLKELAVLGLQVLDEESETPDLGQIREALREELDRAGVSAQVDPDVVRQAVREAVEGKTGGAYFDLADVRRVVEAALSEALNGLSPQASEGATEEMQTEEAEDLLETLDRSLGIRCGE